MIMILCAALLLFVGAVQVTANGRGSYYGSYRTYPTGDTIIATGYNDGGSANAEEKWLVECGDAEAMIGIHDTSHDFEDITSIWCKLLFSDKPPTGGVYPYYDRCVHRNITTGEFQCFDPELNENSLNTMIVALYDDDKSFTLRSLSKNKAAIGTAIKCCGVPPGYTISYDDCHTRYTHDQFWEYYDNPYFIVKCPDSHVMTGMGYVKNPQDHDIHWDWIQCCPVVGHAGAIVHHSY